MGYPNILNHIHITTSNVDVEVYEFNSSYILHIHNISKEFFDKSHIINEFGNTLSITLSGASYYNDNTIYISSDHSLPIIIPKSQFFVNDDKTTFNVLKNTFIKFDKWHGFNEPDVSYIDGLAIDKYEYMLKIRCDKIESMLEYLSNEYKLKVFVYGSTYYIISYINIDNIYDYITKKITEINNKKITEINHFKKYMEVI